MADDQQRPCGAESRGAPALADIPLSVDALLDVLADADRRYLVDYLRDQSDHTASFEAAAKHVITEVAREQGVQPNHDDVQVALHHHHLPKLADAGIVEYDIRSQTIRYHSDERLETLFDRIKELQESSR
jgi:DNA-binding transcriptional ArsR family regulator